MGKLIKYEWRKQRMARMVILTALAAGILVFCGSLLFKEESTAGLSMTLMFVGAFLFLLYTGIESILVLNKDLRTRQSYMLWMLPKSAWEILGAKFIAGILQMLFVFVLSLAAGMGCLAGIIIYDGQIHEMFEAIGVFVEKLTNGAVDWTFVFMFCVNFFFSWALVIMIGFLAVILSRTVLIRSRFAGLFAVILFFVIKIIVEWGSVLLSYIPGVNETMILGGWSLWDILYYILACGIIFAAAGWIAERKLSV